LHLKDKHYELDFAHLEQRLELCLVKGALIKNVFSKRSPKPIGDGKTKESAFHFRSRTNYEATKLCYEYLEKEKYIIENHEVTDWDEPFIFEVYKTNKGAVWFKFKITTD
jgi:hypothetical protein